MSLLGTVPLLCHSVVHVSSLQINWVSCINVGHYHNVGHLLFLLSSIADEELYQRSKRHNHQGNGVLRNSHEKQDDNLKRGTGMCVLHFKSSK